MKVPVRSGKRLEICIGIFSLTLAFIIEILSEKRPARFIPSICRICYVRQAETSGFLGLIPVDLP
jgi:hypothetical protein